MVEVAEVNKVVRVVEVIEVIRVVEVIKVVELVRKLQGRTKGYPTSSAKLRPNFYTWGAGARGGRPVGPTSRVNPKIPNIKNLSFWGTKWSVKYSGAKTMYFLFLHPHNLLVKIH